MGGKLFQGVQALVKSGILEIRPQSADPLKEPKHVEPWKWPNPVRKVWLQIEEDLGFTVSKPDTNNDISQRNLC